jgi:hypothetical protein
MIGLLKDGPFDGQRLRPQSDETLIRYLQHSGESFRYLDSGEIDAETGFRVFVYSPRRRRFAIPVARWRGDAPHHA